MITQYTIFGQVIQILPKKKLYKKGSIGLWKPNQNVIYYQKAIPEYKMSPDNIDQTICHEIIHSWLDKVGYENLSEDEKLVDLLGSCLNEFITSKK
jgi:hypothetical protein